MLDVHLIGAVDRLDHSFHGINPVFEFLVETMRGPGHATQPADDRVPMANHLPDEVPDVVSFCRLASLERARSKVEQGPVPPGSDQVQLDGKRLCRLGRDIQALLFGYTQKSTIASGAHPSFGRNHPGYAEEVVSDQLSVVRFTTDGQLTGPQRSGQ